MTPLRKQIVDLARKYDGAIMSEMDSMMFRGTVGSLDDTLYDSEVFSLLSGFREPVFSISAKSRRKNLVQVHVAEDLTITVTPAPASKS